MTEENGYYKLSDKEIRTAIRMYIEREAGVSLDANVATTLRYDSHRFVFAAEVARPAHPAPRADKVTPPPASASPLPAC